MAAFAITLAVSWYFMRPATASYKSVKAWTGSIATYYSFSGNVAAKNRQSIFTENLIQISEILVKEGDTVKEGDVLIRTADGEEIASEINGEIVHIDVQENEQLMPGKKFLDIVDYHNLEVLFKVDEYDIGALEKGKEATVEIGAAERETKGVISSISREGQIVNGVTFFTATVDIDHDEKIRIGMSAEVKLLSQQVNDVVILPMNVIHFDEQNLPYVLKTGERNVVVQERITTGIHDGTFVEIKSGVLNGENVLHKSNTDLEDMLFPEGGKNVHLGGAKND